MIDESKILQHGESSDFALASIFAPTTIPVYTQNNP